MRVACKRCGASAVFEIPAEGRSVKCPTCGHLTVVPPTGGTEAWATRWYVVLGVGLLVGVLLPLVLKRWSFEYDVEMRAPRSSRQTVWYWDLFQGAKGRQVFLLLLLPALAVATLVVSRTAQGLSRSIALFCAAALVILLSATLGAHDAFGTRDRFFLQSGGAIAILLVLGGVAVAVGNRLRRQWPSSLTARLLAGIGGSVLCLAFLLPFPKSDVSLISLPFEEVAWSEGFWPFTVALTTWLAYGILGAVCFRPAPAPALYRSVTILGRVVLCSLPVAILAGALLASEGEDVGNAVLVSAKIPLLAYGPLGILAVSATAWIAHRSSRPCAAAATATAAPDAPPRFGTAEDLASRLGNLQAARGQGLLTDAEYEEKRKRIVDSMEF